MLEHKWGNPDWNHQLPVMRSQQLRPRNWRHSREVILFDGQKCAHYNVNCRITLSVSLLFPQGFSAEEGCLAQVRNSARFYWSEMLAQQGPASAISLAGDSLDRTGIFPKVSSWGFYNKSQAKPPPPSPPIHTFSSRHLYSTPDPLRVTKVYSNQPAHSVIPPLRAQHLTWCLVTEFTSPVGHSPSTETPPPVLGMLMEQGPCWAPIQLLGYPMEHSLSTGQQTWEVQYLQYFRYSRSTL